MENWQVPLWDAINRYAEACGGDTSNKRINTARFEAVSAVNGVVRSIEAPEIRACLIELADGMDHDDPECPMDDTCECANVARVESALAVPGLRPDSTERGR